MNYVILVGSGYGAFITECENDAEAEVKRKEKSKWEGAIAIFRRATEYEVKTKKPSICWNHPSFSHILKNKFKYNCKCSICNSNKE
jgi:hypothetical protein